MTRRLLLVLTLWSGYLSCGGEEGTLSQPQVRCRAFRYPVAVDCSWTLPLEPNSTTATSFVATYRLGVAARGESQPCLQPDPEAPRCAIPDIQLFSTVPYVLNVTAVRPAGARSTFVPFVPERIIKPDPPEGVRLSPLSGQQLQVWWEPPQSWPFPEIFSLKYWIRYRRHGAMHFRQPPESPG
ncbi:interleukin-27 subunit beta isoform X2 [Octodon degus]|uniref:Interleukin-27 subunit beta isoform X2 n=1 Tax=Octodon degus TaxID=10160 RepID=A0A6P6ELF1_OCTDE|nr:interleukin-27 subunit beta isoform X2 [Octodon degus]